MFHYKMKLNEEFHHFMKADEQVAREGSGRISLAEASRRTGRILSRGASSELETGAAPTFNDLTEALHFAIGDGRNDIEMLRWAGRGVAMGQAVEEVKAAADAETDTVYDEGVVTELARWWPA